MRNRFVATTWLALAPAIGACTLDDEEIDVSEVSSDITNAPAIAGQPAVVRLVLPSGDACTGSLLTRHWILTSAHCTTGQTQGGTLRVMQGMDGTASPSYQGPAYFTPHPDYNDPFLGWWDFDDDIGLVRLTGAGVASFSEQMGMYTGSISAGDEVIIVGYGQGTDVGGGQWCGDNDTGIKREQTFTLDEVESQVVRFPWGSSKTCEGDSGSPHIIPHDDHKFAGAVHSGQREVWNDSVGTKVAPKRDWIRDQLAASTTTPATCVTFAQHGGGFSYYSCYESQQEVRPNELSAGRTHACAVLYDGRARCWGDNQYGQLGDGTLIDRSMPRTVLWGAGGSSLVRIAAGWYHTCATTNAGEVTCWGSNTNGQLGIPSLPSGLYTEGQQVRFADGTVLDDIRDVTAGGTHSCALTNAGRVYCWGSNGRGQLGTDSTASSTQPVLVGQYEELVNNPGGTVLATGRAIVLPRRFIPIENVIEIEAGYQHTCAIKSDYTAYCWGDNTFGQLGNGTQTQSRKPVKVSSLTNVFRISAGYMHTCATYGSAGDRAACWGYNAFGQLGTGNTNNSTTPRVISTGLGTGLEVSAGYLQTCFVGSSRQQKCAGYNQSGELGNNTKTNSSTLVLTSLNNARVPAAGNEFTCTFTHDGNVACTGRNADGQLGANNTLNQVTPWYVHHLHHMPGVP